MAQVTLTMLRTAPSGIRTRLAAAFYRQCGDVAAGRDDRCGAAADELGSEPGEALVMSVRIAVIDAHALSFGEARLRQAAMEFREEMRRLGPRPAAEETEKRGRRLRPRRACLERRRHAGAEDELPPPHSITASDRARSVGGIVRPRDFAVLRLMTESSAAPPESAQKFRRLMCSLAVRQYGRRLRPSVPRSHALRSGETRRPLTFKGKARPPEESGLLVHGRLPKHLPSQPKDHAPTGAGLVQVDDPKRTTGVRFRIVRSCFSAPLDRGVEN